MPTHSSQEKDRSIYILFLISTFLSLGAGSLFAQAPAKRRLTADDVYRMQVVGDPQVSPDGKWIAYRSRAWTAGPTSCGGVIWMVNWEGTQDLQITSGPDSDTSPRWSPDGKVSGVPFGSSRRGQRRRSGSSIDAAEKRAS